eukprot:6100594-Amphidinium_carterae.1
MVYALQGTVSADASVKPESGTEIVIALVEMQQAAVGQPISKLTTRQTHAHTIPSKMITFQRKSVARILMRLALSSDIAMDVLNFRELVLVSEFCCMLRFRWEVTKTSAYNPLIAVRFKILVRRAPY